MSPEQDPVAVEALLAILRTIFRPSSPTDDREMFKGRTSQLSQIVGAVSTPGQHGVVYGERGVGKTSLAYMASEAFLASSGHGLSLRIPCSLDDDFVSIWKKFVPRALQATDLWAPADQEALTPTLERVEDLLSLDEANPESVSRALHLLSSRVPLLVVVDEFDRIGDLLSTQLFSDVIKTLSDDLVKCTLVLIGVADDVDGLVQGHRSIERAMRQVHMPRMTTAELSTIVEEGFGQFSQRSGHQLTVDDEVVKSISGMSQGFPYYTHLLALAVGELAIRDGRTAIDRDMVFKALFDALDNATQMIRVSYTEAVTSARQDASFSDTLLACALTRVDELGFFAPSDIGPALSGLVGSRRTTANYLHHLKRFANEPSWILETRGEGRRARYRFHNPLMKPFVLMKGLREQRIPMPLDQD